MKPAFPRTAFASADVTYEDCGITEAQDGMSLREYFAAKAMQGYLSMYAGDGVGCPSPEDTAKRSVAYADALIAALNEPKASTP